MTKHKYVLGLCSVLSFTVLSVACFASALRETPAVRAIRGVQPSVVNIHSEKTEYDPNALFSGVRGRKVNGMGTGLVVDERGYVVTNFHVVDGVESLRVTTYDGGAYDAQVVAVDRQEDLAIIKINPTKPLPVMPLGTSSDLMLGETVIAMGNAYGYEDTVTGGMVSSLSRDVEVNEKQSYKHLIQTDASINPGNSGGPLVNLDGEVVGINVAIRAGAQRIGFAIPIDHARRVVARMLGAEQISRTFHGLQASDVKQGPNRMLVVQGTAANSPAQAAGCQPGDVIVKAGTVEVVDAVDFERALLGRSAGDNVEIVVRRNGQTTPLTLQLAALPNTNPPEQIKAEPVSRTEATPTSPTSTSNSQTWRLLGLRLTPITAAQQDLVAPRYRGGMRVVQVRPNSPAAATGIRTGDVLVGLHIWETTSIDNLRYVIEHPQLTSFNPLKFYIVREGETLYGHFQLAFRGE